VGPKGEDKRTYAEELREQMRLDEERKKQEKQVGALPSLMLSH
jgi:hypothetical protein